jgi:hypothetical protein
LEEWLYAEYDVIGSIERINEKYLKSEVGGALIHYRYRIGKLIDVGESKPGDLKESLWNSIKSLRATEESKKKSVEMANNAKGRGVRNSTRQKIREAVTLKLVRLLHLISLLK